MVKNNSIPGINLRFYNLFKQISLTQKEFGAIVGLSQTQISTIFHGKSGVSNTLIELLKLKFNVNPDWLREGKLPMFLEKPMGEGSVVPIFSKIPAEPFIDWINSYSPGICDEYIDAPGIHGDHLFGIRVRDNSMEGLFLKGDIIIIDPHKKFNQGLAVIRFISGYKIRNVHKLSSRKFYLVAQNNSDQNEEIIINNETRLYVPVKVISIRDI